MPLDLRRHTPSPPLSLPRRFGRYRLTRLLAVGGMAQIYLAKSFGAEGFVKPLVIKRLDPGLAENPQFTSLFINEAKLLVSLNHGNIVPVFDFGRVDDDLYMAMEYVHGVALRVLLGKRGQALDRQLAAHITAEICKGLDYAHRKTDAQGRPAGIIHRDIKPNNILISREGEVKIVDFGVAKLAGRVEQEGHLTGTLAYMSPEQAERQAVDPRTDVFSAGLVLYEMLSGCRAYGSASPLEILTMARGAQVPSLPDDVPAELSKVVRRAVHRDPEERYATAHEMEQNLAEYLLLARSAGSTVDTVSPASRLAELVGAHALPDEMAEPEAPDEQEPAPALQLATARDLSQEPPDLALIQDAAETFHSEFLTRVLQQAQEGSSSRRRRVLALAGLGLGVVLLGVLAAALWPRGAGPRAVAPDLSPPLRAPTSAPASAPVREPSPRQPDGGASSHRKVGRPRHGYLHLNSIPWSRVTIDGRRLREPTPVVGLRLRAGWHRVVLENREQRLRKSLRVLVRPWTTTRRLVRLR